MLFENNPAEQVETREQAFEIETAEVSQAKKEGHKRSFRERPKNPFFDLKRIWEAPEEPKQTQKKGFEDGDG